MRSSLKVQKALMVPHCISPPLSFVFVFTFWGCFFFFLHVKMLPVKFYVQNYTRIQEENSTIIISKCWMTQWWAQQPHSKKVVASLLTQGLSVWSLRVVLVVDLLCLTLWWTMIWVDCVPKQLGQSLPWNTQKELMSLRNATNKQSISKSWRFKKQICMLVFPNVYICWISHKNFFFMSKCSTFCKHFPSCTKEGQPQRLQTVVLAAAVLAAGDSGDQS